MWCTVEQVSWAQGVKDVIVRSLEELDVAENTLRWHQNGRSQLAARHDTNLNVLSMTSQHKLN
jgi:hypothetical protein